MALVSMQRMYALLTGCQAGSSGSALDPPFLGLLVKAGVGLLPASEAGFRHFEVALQGCEAGFLLAQGAAFRSS